MAEQIDIQVTHGIGYIKEFNGTLNVGSKERFEPTLDLLKQEAETKVKSIGKRYAPNLVSYNALNINLSFSKVFDYFDKKYTYSSILVEIKNIITSKEYFQSRYGSFEDININNVNVEEINELVYFEIIVKKLIVSLNNSIHSAENTKIDFGNSISPSNIHDYEMDIANMTHKIRLLNSLLLKLDSETTYKLHIKSILLITGEALIGKTHLMCDMALNRLNSNKPTVLFFGHEFSDDKSIISNMIHRLGIAECTEIEFLVALNKLGIEHNTRTLIMIDAINETENPKLWQKGIIEFCERIKSYPNLALALSIRDVEKNKLITNDNEKYIEDEIVEIQHRGFEGIEMEAVRTFCNALGVELPKVPLHTNRLFVNPGMLFLYIEIIKETTQKIDTSIINPTTIFKAYIDKLNRDFSQKYSVDEDDRIVEEAINFFISLGTQQDYTHFYIDQKVASKELKTLHVHVLEFLKNEGVFNKYTNDGATTLYFTYQKFENFFIAEYLLNDFEKNRSIIFDLIKGYNGAITEALFMQIPEKLRKDIFDLNVWLIRDRYICEQYITSLVWRKPSSISENVWKYLNFLLPLHNLYDNYLDIVLQLSSIPNHPLNIERLHKRLLRFSIAERDYHWSIYIHNSYKDDGIVKRIIDWAWDKNIDFNINDESLYLYGLTLGWFLTSSNRVLRDGATKALVNIFTDSGDVFLKVLKEFENVDDLYVLERLYAVGYGITLRSTNYNGVTKLGDYIYQTIFNVEAVVEHILLRDYAKLTVEYINEKLSLNIDLKKVQPPYRSVMPTSYPTNEEIKNHSDSLGRGISSIISSMRTESMGSYGDFGRYTFQSNLRNFNLQSIKFQDLSNFAVKVILEEYISDMALFEDVESRLKTHSSSRYDHNIERIGKKYQWMALYKILAIVSDNFEIEDSQDWKKFVPYEGTYQTYIRNIDPTTILKNKDEKHNTWALNLNTDFEHLELSDIEWMSSSEKLPTISGLIDLVQNEKEYLILSTSFSVDGNKEKEKYRNLYYHIDAFVIEKNSINDLVEWAKNNNLYGRDTKIPESHHFSEPYLREYPNSKAYNYIDIDYYGQTTWQTIDDTPFNILLASTAYFNEGQSYDKSVNESIEITLPNKWFIEQMKLKQTLNDGEWINPTGQVVFFDPTVKSCCVSQYNENSVLLANKNLLVEFLEKENLTLFWIMWGEKQVMNTDINYNEKDFLGIAEIQSISYWDGSQIIDEPIKIKFEEQE